MYPGYGGAPGTGGGYPPTMPTSSVPTGYGAPATGAYGTPMMGGGGYTGAPATGYGTAPMMGGMAGGMGTGMATGMASGMPTTGMSTGMTTGMATGMPTYGATGGFTGGGMAMTGGMTTDPTMQYNQNQNNLNQGFENLWKQAAPMQAELKKLFPTQQSLMAQQKQFITFQQTGQAATIPDFMTKMNAVNQQLYQVNQMIQKYSYQLGELTKQAQSLYTQQQTLNMTRMSLGGDTNPRLTPVHIGLKSLPTFMLPGMAAPTTTTTGMTTGGTGGMTGGMSGGMAGGMTGGMTGGMVAGTGGMMASGGTSAGVIGTAPTMTYATSPTATAPMTRATATSSSSMASSTGMTGMTGAVTTGVSAMSVSTSAGGTYSGAPFGTPRPDAQPSLKGPSSYGSDDAIADCKVLRSAMKGLGCDTSKIIEIVCARNRKQRQLIREKFVNIDKLMYAKSGTRDLMKDLKSELSGKVEKVVLNLMLTQGEMDAKYVQQSLDGAGFDTRELVEILFTRSNEQIQDMVDSWSRVVKAKRGMKERISDETKKTFGAGHFQQLCLKILEANRPQGTGKVDPMKVQSDAEQLSQLLATGKTREVKELFISIFTERSFEHIGALVAAFQSVSKKWTCVAAINKAMGDGSDCAKGLSVIAEYSSSPYDFFAKKLMESMKGMGTDDSALIKLITTRESIDLLNIAQVFGERYGRGKTLQSWIKDDTSGAYRSALLKTAGY